MMNYYIYKDFTKEDIISLCNSHNEEYQWIAKDMNDIGYAKKYHGFNKFISFWNNNKLECYTMTLSFAQKLQLKPLDASFGCLLIKDGDRIPDFVAGNGKTYEQKWLHAADKVEHQIKLLYNWKKYYNHLTESEYNTLLKKKSGSSLNYISTHGADYMVLVCPEENYCVVYGIEDYSYHRYDYFYGMKKLCDFETI